MEAALSPSAGEGYRRLSLWWDGLPGPVGIRAPLTTDIDVDVAVVGGGFTGLWTAFYLARADPGLRIAIIERDVVGFGASGRNGGWCSALFAVSEERLERTTGPGTGAAMRRAMVDTVTEVGRVVEDESIQCGFSPGGTVVLARSGVQLDRMHHELAEARASGVGPDDLRVLSAAEAASMVRATRVLGGTFTPHCASVDPARLVRGLAEAVERRGVVIHENTEARAIRPGRVETSGGTVRATTVVRATEGYTRTLRGQKRALVPVYSLMIATEPLSEEFWAGAGLADRQTFADFRHLVIYGQRTADGRMAFGGRGAPYHFGSAIRPEYDRDLGVHEALRRTLVDLFPDLAGVEITHRWGGPLGIARDWFTSVGLDRATGLAWAGGYVGDGVSTTNLAGRTLCDLILERDSRLTALPWVGHRSRRWEPEPLRYLGINAGLRLAERADRAEQRSGRSTWHSRALARVVGG
ncbi:MAG TPA: FAD-binding oxidoreductase [Acidimicrobiales bacterium]|nr:FAD-binding oxidoreductase [Acidimicrobiales bacterium]